MIPIYRATELLKVISAKSGHTRPWVVMVNTPEGLKPYVVKLYTTEHIEQHNSVTAEFIGNFLAREFDLNAPDAAFVEFDENFKTKLSAEQFEQLESADERLKFASAYIEGVPRFDRSLNKSQILSKIDIDTLYAFDNFIRNGDRGAFKPNLLLSKTEAWLIDHERALDIKINTILNFGKNIWEEKFTNYHIFHSYLKDSQKIVKEHYFNEFQEILRTLNLNKLNTLFEAIELQDYDTNKNMIMKYLQHIKENSVKFVTLLRETIQ